MTAQNHLAPGSVWTISKNLQTNDRSWTGDLWEIVATNGNTAWLKLLRNSRSYGQRVSVLIDEHNWFPADHVLAVLDADCADGDGAAANLAKATLDKARGTVEE
jgi:hypothetical protein